MPEDSNSEPAESSDSTADGSEPEIPPSTKKSIGLAIAAIVLTGLIVASLVLATDIILILFLGLLFGVFLHRLSKTLANWGSFPESWSLGIVTLLFLGLIGGGFALFGLQISEQVATASEKLDEGAEQLLEYAGKNPTLKSILNSTPYVKEMLVSVADEDAASEFYSSLGAAQDDQESREEIANEKDPNDPKSSEPKNKPENSTNSDNAKTSTPGVPPIKKAASRAAAAIGKVFSTTLGLVINSLLIFFIGLFLATSPATYRDGVVVLFPIHRRDRVREILNEMGNAMWSWLIGRFGSMLITGVGATVILWLLDIPMAISLGIMTGLLAFIPNIGGSIAFLLAFLVAMSQGFETAVWLIPTYIALQLVESYVATPLIQQKQVAIPPALLIAFQAVFGVLFGFLGAAVASPLLAAGKVGVEEAYIKDVLNDRE